MGQQRDTDGKVYLSISDYENLSHLFTEYFGANGNGRDPVYGTKTFEGVTVIYNNK